MSQDNNELLSAIAAEPAPSTDISTLRRKAVELRDHYLEKADLEQQLKDKGEQIRKIERDELPDMFTQAGISSLTVEPDGNHPGFIAERTTVYTAKIPDDKRQDALQWFEQQGHGDLVKSVVTITFGMQEHEERLRAMKLLSDNNIQFTAAESVHHMTLKAFVKKELVNGRVIPMDLLGAAIFDEVKIK